MLCYCCLPACCWCCRLMLLDANVAWAYVNRFVKTNEWRCLEYEREKWANYFIKMKWTYPSIGISRRKQNCISRYKLLFCIFLFCLSVGARHHLYFPIEAMAIAFNRIATILCHFVYVMTWHHQRAIVRASMTTITVWRDARRVVLCAMCAISRGPIASRIENATHESIPNSFVTTTKHNKSIDHHGSTPNTNHNL